VSARFSFRTSWLVDAPRADVHEVLVDLEHYPDWWPQVVAVAKIDDDRARVLCRSTLPYTLDLLLTAFSRSPELLAIEVAGDLRGSIRWALREDGRGTLVDQQQDVVVEDPWLGRAATLLRPLLVWNHRRMMASGLAGLRHAVSA
jgi:hypothetical protein